MSSSRQDFYSGWLKVQTYGSQASPDAKSQLFEGRTVFAAEGIDLR